MEEFQKTKTEYRKPKTPNINKIILNGLQNSNYNSLIKTKTMKLNFVNNNSYKTKDFNKYFMRKKIASAPSVKRYNFDKFKNYNNNSNKEIQAASKFNKKNLRLISFINISTPFNQDKALYKNLKIEILHKNFAKTPKKLNPNLFKSISTNFLNQKKSDNIPILYPFYSSFNNIYESKSQRARYIKNLDKIAQVQTHLNVNKAEHYKIIKEFMLKNGINEKKFINPKGLKKLENYLKNPINIDPNLTIKEIIKNIINNKLNNQILNIQNQNDDLKISNYIKQQKSDKIMNKNNLKIYSRTIDTNGINKTEIKNLKRSCSSPTFNLLSYRDDTRIIKLYKKYGYLVDKNNLNKIVNNLEGELKKIKSDKINRLEENNKFNDNKIYLMKSYEDNNKFVPNLCLSSKGFSERYKNNINKFNNKIKNIISKNEKIKNINKRMYYDSKQNENLKNFDLNDVRKNHKITELVVLNLGKQELLKQKIGKMNYGENIKKPEQFINLK